MLKFKAFIKEDAELQKSLEELELLDLQEAKAAKAAKFHATKGED